MIEAVESGWASVGTRDTRDDDLELVEIKEGYDESMSGLIM